MKGPSLPAARESRMFWVIGYDGRPAESRGWTCAKTPDVCGADGYWWFPAMGFSTGQVFASKADALAKALVEAKASADKAKALVRELMEAP